MAYYLYKKIKNGRNPSAPTDVFEEDASPAMPFSVKNTQEESTTNLHRAPNDTNKVEHGDQPSNCTSPERTEADKMEARAMRVYRWRLIGGLFFPCVVQGLSTTMIAAALPWIGSDFGMTDAMWTIRMQLTLIQMSSANSTG